MGALSGVPTAVAQALRITGTPVVLQRTTGATYTPGTGATGGTTTSYTSKGVVSAYRAGLVDGTRILAGDMEVLLPASGLVISPDPKTDTVTFGGKAWKVVKADATYAGDDVALWTLQVRR